MYFNNSDFTWPYVKFESQIGHKNLNSRLNLSGTWVRVKIHSTQQGHEGWLNFEMVCGGLGKQTPDLSLGVECRCEMDRPVMDGGMTWRMAEWHGGWWKQFAIDI